MKDEDGRMNAIELFQYCPNVRFSLRGLCDLGVSAVNNGFKYTHRGDAENAEVAQRISN